MKQKRMKFVLKKIASNKRGRIESTIFVDKF